jgi:hypothetical protein
MAKQNDIDMKYKDEIENGGKHGEAVNGEAAQDLALLSARVWGYYTLETQAIH